MEAVRTSETSVDNHFTRQYIPEDNSEHHTRRRENLKSHIYFIVFIFGVGINITQNVMFYTDKIRYPHVLEFIGANQ
jgi:hypothetical protein